MSTGVGERIKRKRLELELSQDELAKRMGLKNKSSICKVEIGDDNLTTTKIRQYAEALGVSPAYLMGWEDFENEVAAGNVEPDKIKKALKLYDLYAHSKPKVQSMVDYLLEEGSSDSSVVIESTPRD